jgi:hypothetical protein
MRLGRIVREGIRPNDAVAGQDVQMRSRLEAWQLVVDGGQFEGLDPFRQPLDTINPQSELWADICSAFHFRSSCDTGRGVAVERYPNRAQI